VAWGRRPVHRQSFHRPRHSVICSARPLKHVSTETVCLGDARYLPSVALREELHFPFDASLYNFRELIVDVFRCDAKLGASGLELPSLSQAGGTGDVHALELLLNNLHRTRAARLAPINSRSRARSNQTVFHKAYDHILRSGPLEGVAEDVRKRFNATLHTFVRGVVAPLLRVDADSVAYQHSPTLRIAYPCGKVLGHPHRDYEYHRQPGELNFWLPLTRVFGSNTLHIESKPGAGDFHPLELSFGRGVRFWGNQVSHYCVANDSGTTRVSIDFRAIALHNFNPDYIDGLGRRSRLRLGEAYLLSGDDVLVS